MPKGRRRHPVSSEAGLKVPPIEKYQQDRSNEKLPFNGSTSFWTLILLSLIVGTVLRLYLISSQILIDDEWHGLNYVIGRSFLYVFTNHGLGANSIPMNLYCWFLLKTFGWSELLLRTPIIIAGILSLVDFPLSSNKNFL